jgi:ferric iron reductase protein FhuF
MSQAAEETWMAPYRIIRGEIPKGAEELPQTDMADSEKLLAFLSKIGAELKSPAVQVTGSLFMKRYGLLVAGAMHGYMRRRQAMDLSPERVTLVWRDGELFFRVDGEHALLTESGPDSMKSAVSARYLDRLFAEQVCFALTNIARTCRNAERKLWATLSYSLYYWTTAWLSEPGLGKRESQFIEQDYAELLSAGGVDRFPGMSGNPMTGRFRMAAVPGKPDGRLAIRSECCLLYCLPGKDRHCLTCPRITDEQRLAKLQSAT